MLTSDDDIYALLGC